MEVKRGVNQNVVKLIFLDWLKVKLTIGCPLAAIEVKALEPQMQKIKSLGMLCRIFKGWDHRCSYPLFICINEMIEQVFQLKSKYYKLINIYLLYKLTRGKIVDRNKTRVLAGHTISIGCCIACLRQDWRYPKIIIIIIIIFFSH